MTVLEQSPPSAHGVAAQAVESFLDAVESMPGVELHSLMVPRRGVLVAAGWWRPYRPDGLHLLYSLSKSFTSSALGIAAGEGLVSLDDPVVAYFPELDREVSDARTRRILVRHLAAMASGHAADTWPVVNGRDPAHPVRAFLRLPPEREPGSVFAYNQSATYTLAAILQRVSGTTLTVYLRSRLLDPLGTPEVAWSQSPPGQDLGFSGLYATTETVALLGELYRNDGVWRGRRILPAHWVQEATSKQIGTETFGLDTDGPRPDWNIGYGFQFWQSRHGYRADGAFGQFSLVLPDEEAVVAMTGQSEDTQALLEAVWEQLLPGLSDAPRVAESLADRRLAERLAGLALAGPGGRPEPPAGLAAFATGTAFAPDAPGAAARPGAAASRAQPSLSGLRIERGSGGLEAVVEDGGAQLRADLGPDWRRARWQGDGPPVYASGGFDEAGRLSLALAFVETPHRLLLGWEPGTDTFAAEWVTTPLHDAPPLRLLGAPPERG